MEAVDRFAKLKSGKTTSGCVETLLLITTVVLYWLRSYGSISVPKFYAQWSIRKSPIQGVFYLLSTSILFTFETLSILRTQAMKILTLKHAIENSSRT